MDIDFKFNTMAPSSREIKAAILTQPKVKMQNKNIYYSNLKDMIVDYQNKMIKHKSQKFTKKISNMTGNYAQLLAYKQNGIKLREDMQLPEFALKRLTKNS